MGSWGTGLYDDDHALDAAATLREAADPEAYLERVFSEFLSHTAEGFDKSDYSESWARPRALLALCDVVRLACARVEVRGALPRALAVWLDGGLFHPTASVIRLAADCMRRMAESTWLPSHWPEFWRESVVPLAQHYLGS